ncbi:SOS response-associated peptidase [Simiduia sp. 21SJ11W-1]|uniref:SOS response-associated peptidase family protein n=1 Tax=Simiduia sp. 21SJ11W-1 TaxID=2909669 RepID=UPI00209DD31A|nr:SOS response-associated peptidase family protein [Simiduia sp. 21SJ11W-1]UTA48048.1 SOS response-associated peptidase [Simiduia sp. 21SJ11W-1]
MRDLGLDDSQLRYSADCAPCNPISIITGNGEGPMVQDALWHLYLEPTATGFKPHPRYWSINTNWAQLPKKREFKISRCLIPATSFVESQDGKRPHQLQFEGEAFCFGGLYKRWAHAQTGETVTSASIITLAGHPKLEGIHRKSLPLIFNQHQLADMQQWLNPALTDTTSLQPFLVSQLRLPLTAQPIDKSSSKNPIAEAFVIPADAGQI